MAESTMMLLRDAPAREQMRSALDRNVVLLAGAGAGKTQALIDRMVATIRGGRETVDHLAAITFTHKAAGEMRGRFHDVLRRQLGEATGVEASRMGHALEHLDRCFIGTIHAFSARLLRERPLEAGLDPGFREITEHQELQLRRETWDRYIQETYQKQDPRVLRLPDLGLRAEDLYAFYSLRVRHAELPLIPADVPVPDLRPSVDLCMEFYNDHIGHLPESVPAGRDGVQEALERSRHLLAHSKPETNADRISFIALWASAEKVTLNRWPDSDFARSVRDTYIPKLHTLLNPVMTQWRQHVYSLAKDIADEAAFVFADTCRQQGGLTFQQLLMEASRLLREVPDVRRWFQDRYRILFVDEFQDTDPVQAEIVFYLTGDDPNEPDWRKVRPRAGSLVVVGDEKQSIYRFRRADIEVFQDVERRIQSAGGSTLQLTSSFRSAGALCSWLNRALGPVLERDVPPYQAAFEPLHEVRPTGADSTGVRRITTAKRRGNDRSGVAVEDAERIADFISAAIRGETEFNDTVEDALMGQKAEPSDFLILTRTRARLPQYAQALESRGIPYDVVGAGALKRSQELRSVLQLLEAVIVPDNPVPVVGVLRGSLIGLGDDELYAYRKAGGRFDFTRRPRAILPEPLDERIAHAFDIAHSAATFVRTFPPSVAFERILEDLGLIPYAASGAMGSSRAGALLRAVALVRQWEASGFSWTEILDEMQAVQDNPEYIVEDMTLEAGRSDVVRLMVVHQAKGLEANVVFLADPTDAGSRQRAIEAHVSRVGDTATLSAPIVRKRGEYSQDVLAEPPGWAESVELEKRFQAAESDRLLYVAATRARNLLVVSRYEGALDRGPWSALEPALRDVEELSHFPPHFPYKPGSPDLDIEKGRHLRRERWEAVRRPTLSMATVTGNQNEFEPVPTLRKGRGRDYGVLVHELFEAAVTKTLPEDRSAFVIARVEDRGLDQRMGDRALEALRAFEGSDLWIELTESERAFTEVPLVTSGLATSDNGDDVTKVLRGTIDLLYRTDSGWKLVDYKTDAAPDDNAVSTLLDRYSDQVRTYASQWESITDESVAEKGIWLTDGGRWLVV